MNLKKLKVRQDNIIVDPIDPTVETEEGLIQTSEYEEKTYSGTVVAVGDSVEEIKVGDIVYFNKYSTTTFPYQDKEFQMLKLDDVIAYTIA